MSTQNQHIHTREKLRSLVIDSFSKEPEVFAIYFFGKEVENKSDRYSDIDMVVCSNDLAKTQANYLNIFNETSPVIGTFLLESQENQLAQMIMLKDFSPYQKIDLSITDGIETKISAGFGPFVQAYIKTAEQLTHLQKPPLKGVPRQGGAGVLAHEQAISTLTIIQENPIKHQLYDFLFSVPRFTKCLFRQDYDIYRRWKGISDIVTVLLYEKYFGWEENIASKSLSAKQSSRLYDNLSYEDNKLLQKILPLSGNLNIVQSYAVAMELLISLCRQKADHFKIQLDEDFIQYIKVFLDTEIRLIARATKR